MFTLLYWIQTINNPKIKIRTKTNKASTKCQNQRTSFLKRNFGKNVGTKIKVLLSPGIEKELQKFR